jgi:DNA-binding CsgD family transcriptional regulator
MDNLQVFAYVASVLLTVVSIGAAWYLYRISGVKHFWNYLFFILCNNLVCFLDLVFRYFPAHVESLSLSMRSLDMLSGLLIVPLMAACVYFGVSFFIGITGDLVPGFFKVIYGIFWGLLFLGFVAAEFLYFRSGDFRLTNFLNPVFNSGVILGIMYGMIHAFIRSTKIVNKTEKLTVRAVVLYYFLWFFLFSIIHTTQLPLHIKADILFRSLLGLAYNLPPLLWFVLRLRKTKNVSFQISDKPEGLNSWLESKNISPREREIFFLILQGKNNRHIEKELYISRRTVESHIYSIYKKLGIKNRLQLVRLAVEKSREIWPGT